MNRIRQYTDSSGDTPITYHDVEPLLTPRFTTFERAQLAATRQCHAGARDAVHEPLVPPEHERLAIRPPGGVQSRRRASRGTSATTRSWSARNNLTDSKKYGSGYASDGVSYYFVVPPRNFFVALKVGF